MWICEAVTKQKATRRYNSKLQPRAFKKGDLVWHIASNVKKHDEKFSINWEWPFWVADKGAYKLEYLSEQPIPNTWNITHLKLYFSYMLVIRWMFVTHIVLFPYSISFS